VIAPVQFGLPQGFTLLFDPELDILANADGDGRHANYQMLANLSHALSGSVTGYVELWGEANQDPAAPKREASLDFALAWIPWPKRPNLQLDAGANLGLTPATPKTNPYIGVSQRF
jgi:hypothetical protein